MKVLPYLLVFGWILSSSAFAGPRSTVSTAHELREAYRKLDGAEITVVGYIGVHGDQIYYSDQTGVYPVKLDAGRQVRHEIEQCRISLYSTQSFRETGCRVTGKAELDVNWSDATPARGWEIRLILFEAQVSSSR